MCLALFELSILNLLQRASKLKEDPGNFSLAKTSVSTTSLLIGSLPSNFNSLFIYRFIRILFSSIVMGLFFNFLVESFNNELAYSQNFKSVYLIGLVLLSLSFYLIIAFLIKAFKFSDINLKYK